MDVALERRLARRAARQSGLITRTQLIKMGASRGQIARLVKAERLAERYGGVYLVGGAPPGRFVELAAACLCTGGVASHRSAAHLQGLVDLAPSRPELTVGPTQNMRVAPLLHRSSDLMPRDVLRIEGIRATNATRTLIDLGSVVTTAVLECALERALHQRLTTFDRLVRRFFEIARRGRPGVGPLRALLVDRDPNLAPAESDLETLAVRLRRNGSAASPRELLRSHQARCRVFVSPLRRSRTVGWFWRAHDPQCVWHPLGFTWRHICHDPQRVIAHVSSARERRRRELS